VTSLVRRLRESSAEVSALVRTKGGSADDVAREVDSLISALDRGATDELGATALRRLVGSVVFVGLERHGATATVPELRIVHEWVLGGVATQVEALEASQRADARVAERLHFILPNARIMVGEIGSTIRGSSPRAPK